MNIRNRIIEMRTIDPSEVQPNSKNWRAHPQAQRDALRGVLADIGIAGAVLAYESPRNGGLTLIDGHERMTVGAPFPALILDVTDAEADVLLATYDPLGALAETNAASLDALLRDVSTDSPAVQAMLDELAINAGIVPGIAPGGGGDEFDTTPDDGPTRCQLGDLWLIDGGRHRLLVGDCTDAANVARVMDGEKATAVVSDPPYGIDWNTNYTRFTSGYNIPRRNSKPIANDNHPFDPTPWLDYPIVVLFGANYFAQSLPVGTWLVWDKRHSNGTALLSDAELAWLNKNKGVYIYSKTWQGIVRDEDIEHPTQKPVGLFEWCFERAGLDLDATILDPFLGSGTTLIAAHRTGRRCYGLEISERYCDVILRRCEAEHLSVELAQ